MKNVTKVSPFFILLKVFLLISAQLTFTSSVNSIPSTEISISPSHTITKIEENFTVYIQLNNTPPFIMFGITVTYNSTVLDTLNATITLPDGNPQITIQETEGIIDIIWIGQPLEGNQTLAKITFQAILDSNSTLHLSNTELYDPQYNLIPHTTTDGTIEILGPLSITVQSIQSAYYLGQNATIYGNLTIQETPIASVVGIEAHTLEGTILIRTTKTGEISQSTQWPIEVINFYTSDEYGNPQSSFAAGQKAYLTINVENRISKMLPILVTVNGFDKYNTPFGLNFIQTSISPSASLLSIIELFIPAQCPNGNAGVYLNIFSNWPRNGGIPYIPEQSTSFQITGGSTSVPPSIPSNNQTFTAHYNLTFRLPSQGGLANWNIYATVFYKIQSAQAQTRFVAANIFVDDDEDPADFNTIQAAINAANHRDIIYVYNGTYRENITVNKTLSIVGESNNATVIDGMKLDTVVKITEDHVNIINLQIINSSSTTDHNIGISILSHSCTLINNVILNNTIGIKVNGFPYTLISENKIEKNIYGIMLYNANYTRISKNELTNNNFGTSSSGVICSNNTITNEIIIGNDVGIQLVNTIYSTITECSIINNTHGVVLLDSSYQNTLNKNNVSFNIVGITLDSSSNNRIIENTISNNTNYGLWLSESNNNQIYGNNFVDNANHTYCSAVANQWDYEYPVGGNYWSNYTGIDEKSGPNQDQPGSDGIGDSPYQIWELENVDHYPLMKPTYEQDVGITDIFLSKNLTAIGYPMRIHVRIVNYGSERQTFTLTVYFNETYLDSTSVILERRSFTTITFWWYPTGTAPSNYTISASASIVKDEKNTANNQLTGGSVLIWPLVGDFDCNQIVGPSDFARLSWCYYSKPGDPRWYPNADINEDDRIGPYDFAVFSIHYYKRF